jgi:hypothetical protein
MNEEHYEDWLNDFKDTLAREFIEEFYSDEFMKFCKEEYNNWRRDK